jgi:hypothetical protein
MLCFSYRGVSNRFMKRAIVSRRYASAMSLSFTLEQQVSNGLRACGVHEDSSHLLLLSVSGGVDSMGLLHICGRLKHHYRSADFHVVNFNHKARPEADDEVSCTIFYHYLARIICRLGSFGPEMCFFLSNDLPYCRTRGNQSKQSKRVSRVCTQMETKRMRKYT